MSACRRFQLLTTSQRQRLKALRIDRTLCRSPRMFPGSSWPSTMPEEVLNIPSKFIRERILDVGNSLCLYQQGSSFLQLLPSGQHQHWWDSEAKGSDMRDVSTSQLLGAAKCHELQSCQCTAVYSPVWVLRPHIQDNNLPSRIASEQPELHAYTSASADDNETSFWVLEDEKRRHPPIMITAQETDLRVVLSLAQLLSVKTSRMHSPLSTSLQVWYKPEARPRHFILACQIVA